MKQIKSKFKYCIATVAFASVLGGCQSSVTSIGIPADSPWRVFETTIATQYNDLIATPVGMVVNAQVVDIVGTGTPPPNTRM